LISFRLSDVYYGVGSRKNRRAFTRFLKAAEDGESGYVQRQPLTSNWRRSQTGLDLSLWEQGIEISGQTEREGKLHLRVEQIPWKVLQMGKYSNTCLAFGGCSEHSAAAVMLDINKQVVYARNEKGAVVARQLLAISEERNLVAFVSHSAG